MLLGLGVLVDPHAACDRANFPDAKLFLPARMIFDRICGLVVGIFHSSHLTATKRTSVLPRSAGVIVSKELFQILVESLARAPCISGVPVALLRAKTERWQSTTTARVASPEASACQLV